MPASVRVQRSGRAARLPDVLLTNKRERIAAVITKRQSGSNDPWCIATSLASEILYLYRKRMSIEETFRDQKGPPLRPRPARHAYPRRRAS